jgi:hypothetical protein
MNATNSKEIVADKNLIAFCGLYCGSCKSYLSGKCPGCKDNVKASWCKVRQCNMENNFQSCADCTSLELMSCKKYNNFISKAFGVIFNSDRPACIYRIKEVGYSDFAIEMANSKRQSIKRR